jgi:hypothetical protein
MDVLLHSLSPGYYYRFGMARITAALLAGTNRGQVATDCLDAARRGGRRLHGAHTLIMPRQAAIGG